MQVAATTATAFWNFSGISVQPRKFCTAWAT